MTGWMYRLLCKRHEVEDDVEGQCSMLQHCMHHAHGEALPLRVSPSLDLEAVRDSPLVMGVTACEGGCELS